MGEVNRLSPFGLTCREEKGYMKKILLAGTIGLLLMTNMALASITPTLKSIIVKGPNDFLYTYQVTLTTNDQARPSDTANNNWQGFTIYDFAGYISGTSSFTPAGSTTANDWNGTTPFLGITPTHPTNFVPGTPDSGSTINLSWEYTGTDSGILSGGAGPSFDTHGNTILGFFSAESIYNGDVTALNGNYTGATFEDNGAGFAYADNAGSVGTPSVPEPSSMLLLGSGLAGMATILKKRLKK